MAKDPKKNQSKEDDSLAKIGPDGNPRPMLPAPTPMSGFGAGGAYNPGQSSRGAQSTSGAGSYSSSTSAGAGPGAFTGAGVDKFAKAQDGQGYSPPVYESAGRYGSGFVNLSHLLALNKDSAQFSAKDLAKKMALAGEQANINLGQAEDDFNKAAKAGSVSKSDYADDLDPALVNDLSGIKAKADAGYRGPSDLASMSGYSDLSKVVGGAADMSKNLSSGGHGIAAEVGKDTGLSPVQSAASAFYMGVNNSGIKGAAAPFMNLRKSLENANAKAMQTSDLARKTTAESAADIANLQAKDKTEYDDYITTANVTEARKRIQDAKNKYESDRADTKQKFGKDAQTYNAKEEIYANQMGVPQELIWSGIYYDQWVADGKPSWEDYKKSHPEAEATLNRITGRS